MELTNEGAVVWRIYNILKPGEKRQILGFYPTVRELNRVGLFVRFWVRPSAHDEWANGGEDYLRPGRTGREAALLDFGPVLVRVIDAALSRDSRED
jgi:hypothetical protein